MPLALRSAAPAAAALLAVASLGTAAMAADAEDLLHELLWRDLPEVADEVELPADLPPSPTEAVDSTIEVEPIIQIVGIEVAGSVQGAIEALAEEVGAAFVAVDSLEDLAGALGAASGLPVDTGGLSDREVEPNDGPGKATTIAANGPVTGDVVVGGEVDYYQVDIPTAGRLDVLVTGMPAELGPSLRMLDADFAVLSGSGWTSAEQPGVDVSAAWDLPHPGRFILQLDGDSDGDEPAPYRLELAFTEAADPFEPNDRFSQAADIAADSEHQLNVFPRGDLDLLRLEVASAGGLLVDANAVPEGVQVAFRVRDDDFVILPGTGWFEPSGTSTDTMHSVDLPRPGAYYLELGDWGNDAASIEPYTLRLAFAPIAETGEPNDRFADAAELQLDTPTPMTVLPRGDVDWLALDLPAAGKLHLTATEVPPELGVVYRIYDADRQLLPRTGWFSPPRDGADTDHVIDIPTAGRYLLEIGDGGGDASTAQPYQLIASLEAAEDGGEPNDRPSSATALAPNGLVAAAILPLGDADWFALELASAGTLTVTVSDVPPDLDINFRLRDANLEVVRGTGWFSPPRPGADTAATIDLGQPGRYLLEVVDGGNNASAAGLYALATGFTDSADHGEPDASLDLARPLTLGSAGEGAIFPSGDRDHFAVDLDEPGRLDVLITDLPGELGMAYRLWGPDGSGPTGWTYGPSPGADVLGEHSLEEPGRYVVETAGAESSMRSTSPYALHIDLKTELEPGSD